MMTFTLQRAAQLTYGVCQANGEPVNGSHTRFCGVAIDSRQVQPGNLFIALRGARVDGHDYVTAAMAAGAAAAMVERPLTPAGAAGQDVSAAPLLVVEDSRTGLAQLAAAWRHQLPVTVIGITGSNGKTTVKNLLAGVLAQAAPTLATPGNFNNELGLPLTLCQLSEEHEYAVLEMGARHAGDIEVLAALAAHSVGVLTNAGPAHLETFGSLEGVARGKAEIFTSLPPDGVAIVNADDRFAAPWREACGERLVISFGRSPAAAVNCADHGPRCTIHTPVGRFTTTLQLHGAHNVMNALAATAAALALDVPLDTIARGLAAVAPEFGRMQYHTNPAGWVVIDDTYNANPASLYAAISTVAEENSGELWLALGDMGELGEGERKLHAEMGEAARQLGVKRLFATGELCADAVRAFGSGGEYFASRADLIEKLCGDLHAGVRCLVKGSRAAGMEHVVQALLARCTGRAG